MSNVLLTMTVEVCIIASLLDSTNGEGSQEQCGTWMSQELWALPDYHTDGELQGGHLDTPGHQPQVWGPHKDCQGFCLSGPGLVWSGDLRLVYGGNWQSM